MKQGSIQLEEREEAYSNKYEDIIIMNVVWDQTLVLFLSLIVMQAPDINING